ARALPHQLAGFVLVADVGDAAPFVDAPGFAHTPACFRLGRIVCCSSHAMSWVRRNRTPPHAPRRGKATKGTRPSRTYRSNVRRLMRRKAAASVYPNSSGSVEL